MRGHGGADKTGFDGQYPDAFGVQPVSQPLHEGADCRLGGAVNIITLTPPVTRDRANGGDGAPALPFKIVGENGQKRQRPETVRAKLLFGRRKILFAQLLVAQAAVADENALDEALC